MGEGEGSHQEELRAAQQKRLQQLQADQQKRELLRKMMDPAAYERMTNVRISSPDLYENVVSSLAQIAQSGRRMERITEEQLVGLLTKMTARPETKIEFRKK